MLHRLIGGDSWMLESIAPALYKSEYALGE